MSATDYFDDVSLPVLIRTHTASHLARMARAPDLLTLSFAVERAEGFVEGVEAARGLTPATIEALLVLLDNAAKVRRQELTP
ncbi:hypothetical protein ATI14_4153 [Pseudomonas tolaasii NCPPB 2192]|uniref:Uncharacterized protein n=1 Tax=Pseudomonas tolaasii NCPPB 2192 TaxID=564423 RepID=A0ABX4QK08_PSETO|nr:hypothetical protein B5P22_08295 [Pseudomonas tolaasii]PKA77126.1 hypothetical protein ATI14_4153 [Pseudomonas tolaasii NCPPB 2192]